MKDHEIAKMVNDLTEVAKIYAGTQQLRARIGSVVKTYVKGLNKEPVWVVEPYENACVTFPFWHVVGKEGVLFESALGESACRKWVIDNGYRIHE